VDIVEYPAVIISGGVLAKTVYVYIGDLERGILSGLIPVNKPLILGSSGVVRVIEVLGERTEYTGKYYVITPLGNRGFLGLSVNGLLSNYVSLDDSYLEEELSLPTPIDAIRPFFKHVALLASMCEEPVLVEGCGLIGVMLGGFLRELGMNSQLYCESGKRNASILDLNVTSHISNLSKKWRTLVITSLNTASKYRVMSELEYSNLVISALSLTELIPLKRSYSMRVVVVRRERHEGVEEYIVNRGKKVLHELFRAIKVIKASDLDSIRGLLPPRGLGTIIELS
jgi:DNA-binding HxlR family transcriptional regulator